MTQGFGIVGCGMIARFHARAIRELTGARLAACFDGVAPAAEKLAGEFGCKAYSKLEEMLADPDVTIVTIATPSGSHADPAVAAAKAGKHVIVEKPLEITLDRCDSIINACAEAGVKLASVFPSRYHASCRLVKKAVEEKRFGRLTLGDAYVKWHRTQAYYDSGAWRGTWELDGGGALMNQAIHSIDLLLWMMGPVVEVSAITDTLGHERIAVEDVAVATVRFASGAVGVIEGTTAAFPGYLKRVELHGTHGSAVIEEEVVLKWDFAEARPEDEEVRAKMAGRKSGGGGAGDPSAIGYHGHKAQFQEVVDAVTNDTPLALDGREGRKAVELILAIYLSAETGQKVQLPLKSDPVLQARKRKKGS